MPKTATIKPGSKNRSATAHDVQFLSLDGSGDQVTRDDWFGEIIDPDGEWFSLAKSRGLEINVDDDYLIVDGDGETVTLKSAAQLVRKVLRREIAERLNVPVTVSVPDKKNGRPDGQVTFLIRMDEPFADEAERQEYLSKS